VEAAGGKLRPDAGVGPDASRCDVDGGPTIGLDGTIYFGGDAVYAVNPNGDLRWRFATGGHVSTAPAVMPDGTVIAGSMDNNLYAINKDGTKRWDFRARADVESSPAIEEDGTIYFGSDDNKLYAISPLGQIVWAFSTGDDIRAAPPSAATGRCTWARSTACLRGSSRWHAGLDLPHRGSHSVLRPGGRGRRHPVRIPGRPPVLSRARREVALVGGAGRRRGQLAHPGRRRHHLRGSDDKKLYALHAP